MKEQSITTHIGDEIKVVVYFDYQPREARTHVDPGCDSDVTINGVCVDGDEGKDISLIINASTFDAIKIECFEKMEPPEPCYEDDMI